MSVGRLGPRSGCGSGPSEKLNKQRKQPGHVLAAAKSGPRSAETYLASRAGSGSLGPARPPGAEDKSRNSNGAATWRPQPPPPPPALMPRNGPAFSCRIFNEVDPLAKLFAVRPAGSVLRSASLSRGAPRPARRLRFSNEPQIYRVAPFFASAPLISKLLLVVFVAQLVPGAPRFASPEAPKSVRPVERPKRFTVIPSLRSLRARSTTCLPADQIPPQRSKSAPGGSDPSKVRKLNPTLAARTNPTNGIKLTHFNPMQLSPANRGSFRFVPKRWLENRDRNSSPKSARATTGAANWPADGSATRRPRASSSRNADQIRDLASELRDPKSEIRDPSGHLRPVCATLVKGASTRTIYADFGSLPNHLQRRRLVQRPLKWTKGDNISSPRNSISEAATEKLEVEFVGQKSIPSQSVAGASGPPNDFHRSLSTGTWRPLYDL